MRRNERIAASTRCRCARVAPRILACLSVLGVVGIAGFLGHHATRSPARERPTWNSGVFVASIENGAVVPGTTRRLGPEWDGWTFYAPTINPEGTLVVFCGKDPSEKADIWVSAVDGTRLKRLTEDGLRNDAPVWSPDGKLIVYRSNAHIWIMNTDGSNKRQLTFGPYEDSRPAIHPSGNVIVFCSNRSGIANLWRTDLDGREPVQVTKHDGLDWRPNFSPNGQSLAYFTGPDWGEGFYDQDHNLAVLSWPDGGKPTYPVTLSEGEWIHGPFWSSDNVHVFVHGLLMGGRQTRVFRVDTRSGSVELVAMPGFKVWAHATLNQDETLIAFDGIRDVVVPAVVMSATPLKGPPPLSVTFDGRGSIDPNGHIVSCKWLFGDGRSATGPTVTHTYTDAGTYTATLVVTDDQRATARHEVRITATPAATE